MVKETTKRHSRELTSSGISKQKTRKVNRVRWENRFGIVVRVGAENTPSSPPHSPPPHEHHILVIQIIYSLNNPYNKWFLLFQYLTFYNNIAPCNSWQCYICIIMSNSKKNSAVYNVLTNEDLFIIIFIYNIYNIIMISN